MPDGTRQPSPETDAIRITRDVAARLERFAEAGPGAALPPLDLPDGPRAVLCGLFGLTPAERALLDLCVAVTLEPALEERVSGLQGRPWRPQPTEALARALYGLAPGAICRPAGALARWQLVQPLPDPAGAAPAFRADAAVADWMDGRAALDDGLVGLCRLPAEQGPVPDWPVAETAAALRALAGQGGPVRLVLVGPRGSGRAEFAAAVTAAFGHGALEVEGAGLAPDLWLRVQRFALLTGRVPVWRGVPPAWPMLPEAAPLQCLLLEDRAAAPRDGALVLERRQPALTAGARAGIWRALTGQALPMALARAPLAELRGMAPLAAVPGAVEGALRERAHLELAGAGRVLSPRVGWEDLVVSDSLAAALRGFTAEARRQAALMADPDFRRLFARDASPSALFTGPPGVGKTMAAECVARELGLPLLVVDVSRTLSKYIGETAKNLSRIFDEARRFGCLLFFDEADAWFSRRTELKDAQDRHANADTGHLLQLVEAYEGCVILGTNRRGHIDEAFLRRIRHVIEFPRPERAERLRLWQGLAERLFTPAERAGAAEALATCAERFPLTPAQIKAALLTARYAAAPGTPLDASLLLGAVARELRKEGRGLPPDLATLADARMPVTHRERPDVA
ncbi:ATP-binding protein [Oceanicella sp. SM1341]|uniref:ATP-binding protein n=1 Tax=Oceanicella sp. SM1341 TaxID=1548889 RepID=UPI000E4D0D4E|nr:ATP-binding protein [Oceanicella sp. SM1341]